MFERIQYLDEFILYWIHDRGSNELFDVIMPWFRNPYFWAPVYLFILTWMWLNHKKKGLIWCLFLVVVFACCDFTAASLIKPWVHRLRPCHNPHLAFNLRNLVHCGSGFSFPSAHAANHFGISFFILFTWLRHQPLAKFLVIFWACLVVYAQLYVVVHYPSDVVAGALVGIVYSSLLAEWYLRRFGDIDLQKLPASNS